VEDQDLVATSFTQHGSHNLGSRRLGDSARLGGNCQYIAKFDRIAFHGRLFNLHHIARGDTVLLSTCADHRVHNASSTPKSGARLNANF
jgi:hypothetical protein